MTTLPALLPLQTNAPIVGGAPRSGFECKQDCGLDDWSVLATAWHAWLERTIARCDGLDAPYCHSEHGCTHSFMAAAESAGWSTLREVVGNRGDEDSGDGYLDACFIGDKFVDMVEAKHSEFKVTAAGVVKDSDFKKMEVLVRSSTIDAEVYYNRHPMFAPDKPFRLPRRRIGTLFATGWLETEPEDGTLGLQAYLAKMRTLPHDVMAWSFPKAVHGLRYWNRHYVGVVMLATLVRTESAALV